MKNIWLLLGLLQAGASTADATFNKGLPTYITVGPGASCNFNTSNGATLQDALNAAAEEIRLVNRSSYVGVFNTTGSVYLRGGFDSCADAASNIQGFVHSEIDADYIGSALSLSVSGDYIIENIRITHGLANQAAPDNTGGGINIKANDVTLLLDQVIVEDNTAMFGGGIAKAVAADNVFLTLIDSQIMFNHTLLPGGFGGGIYFEGTGEMVAYGDTWIRFNDAENGGGIYLKNTKATLVVGPTVNRSGIIANTSTISGAGVYSDNSTLNISGGTKDIPGIGVVGASGMNYLIKDNVADSDSNLSGGGGGLLLYNNSRTFLNAISVINNTAYSGGGGIYALQGVRLYVGTLGRSECHSGILAGCNLFENNSANGQGGALYSSHFTISNLNSVAFTGNRSNSSSVAYMNQYSTINLTSSILYNNGDPGNGGYNELYSLGSFNFSQLNIQHTTAVKNKNSTSFVYLSHNTSTNAVVSYNNYFYNPQSGPWVEDPPGTTPPLRLYECQMVDSANNVNVSIYHQQTVSSLDHETLHFVDEANADFHLSDGSPLVDYVGTQCPPNNNMLNSRDIDNDPRTPAADLGADENLVNDIIFVDGFEG